MGSVAFFVLVVIETLQMLFFTYANKLEYTGQNLIVGYVLEPLNYIQVASQ